jgi:hypothetical protein
MRKTILLVFIFAAFAVVNGVGQQVHPISTASITPNVSEGKAELMFEEPVTEQLTVVIKDLTGHVMLTVKSDMPGESCTMITLDIETLKNGIYICQITGSSGKIKTLKFHKA